MKKKNNNNKTYNIIKNIITFPKYIIIGIQFFFNEKKQKELKMEEKIIPIIIYTLTIITYLICIFIISRWYVQNARNKNLAKDLNQNSINIETKDSNNNNMTKKHAKYNYKYPDDLSFLNVNLNPYIKKNPETVAWIQVNGTIISYPVVKHKDNNYYLNHDFYKRKTDIGAIFADYRDNFNEFNDNTIIYGHNIVNGTMFAQLTHLLTKNWQSNKNYHYIKLSTKKTNSIWKIFSVYEIKPTIDYLQSNFNSIKTYQEFLNLIQTRSNHNFNTKLNTDDKIITLSTCNNIGNKRIVVHAKLINLEKKET